MSAAKIVVEVLGGLLAVAPDAVELITGVDRVSLGERIERAREFIKDPIDPSADDAEKRAELERILAGAG